MSRKQIPSDLAIFGAPPLFEIPRSTSNLLKPDFDRFMAYARPLYCGEGTIELGSVTAQLENRLAQLHQTRDCITFSSGFWGIVSTIASVRLPGKSEIIMPSLTYRRMADIACWLGLTPRYCDVDPKSLAISADTVAPHINDNTAVILAPHPIVNTCDIRGLRDLAHSTAIPLIFDSVESVYESSELGKVGSHGEAEAFSLHACKLINGFGGGYVTTNNPTLAEHLRSMRQHGEISTNYGPMTLGLDSHLNDAHAALALASLDDLPQQISRNQQRYLRYLERLDAIPGIALLRFDENYATAYKNIVIELLPDWPLSRSDTVAILNRDGILARPHYSPPLHQRATRFPTITKDLPNTDALSERYVNLPCGHRVSTDDIDRICDLLDMMRTQASTILPMLEGQTTL